MARDVTPAPQLTDEQSAMQSLRRNAGFIVSAIALALAGYFGWNYYQQHGGRVDTQATNDFAKIQSSQQAIQSLSEQNTEASKQQLNEKTATLQKDIASYVAAHPDTAYAWQALMMQAKQQSDNNQTKEAVDTLKQATQLKLNDAGLQAIATLRYAQALLANKQPDEAKTALGATLPPIFDASKNELLGDIAMAKNDKTGAIDAYQKAWQAIEERNKTQPINKEDRALLRLKMEDLGLSPKIPEETESVIAKPAQTEPTAATATSAPAATATSSSQANSEPKTAEKTKALAKTAPAQAQSTDTTQTQKSEPKI